MRIPTPKRMQPTPTHNTTKNKHLTPTIEHSPQQQKNAHTKLSNIKLAQTKKSMRETNGAINA
ncbi:MAG: hypothetical protein ACE366_21405 [Bradymonadia bacterium]